MVLALQYSVDCVFDIYVGQGHILAIAKSFGVRASHVVEPNRCNSLTS